MTLRSLFAKLLPRDLQRFATVGLVANILAYAIYAMLVHTGIGAKTAITIVFAGFLPIMFALNRNWSFQHKGKVAHSFVLYVIAQFVGYLTDLLVLVVLVDQLQWSPYPAEILAIVAAGGTMFCLSKWVIFKL